ncbi:hypothetical protein HRI_004086200 [Hibiscus trionum]|uniref:Retrotransposon Copia-like N-terminal domain-containing protein n=1 Tax=Hibiscus trionum TaxID=183268 RepID=A0A9W7IYB6_HIBTR|nr:hypothetical protein HRI_004086200 [Hibiscus trionum]
MAENASAKPFTNKTMSIHLDNSNYLLWKHQILFAIESLALVDHIDGSLVISTQFVAGEGGRRVVNPEYVCYKQEDSTLYSWLISFIGSSILPFVVNCKNALGIWEKVKHIFYVTSITRIMHMQCSLKNIRKRDQTMREYVEI